MLLTFFWKSYIFPQKWWFQGIWWSNNKVTSVTLMSSATLLQIFLERMQRMCSHTVGVFCHFFSTPKWSGRPGVWQMGQEPQVVNLWDSRTTKETFWCSQWDLKQYFHLFHWIQSLHGGLFTVTQRLFFCTSLGAGAETNNPIAGLLCLYGGKGLTSPSPKEASWYHRGRLLNITAALLLLW